MQRTWFLRDRTICTAIALILLATCSAWARTHGKVTKPPRGALAAPARMLQMPAAYRVQAAMPGRLNHRLATGKRARSPAAWTLWRDAANKTPIFMQFDRAAPAGKRAMLVAPAAAARGYDVLCDRISGAAN